MKMSTIKTYFPKAVPFPLFPITVKATSNHSVVLATGLFSHNQLISKTCEPLQNRFQMQPILSPFTTSSLV